MATKIFCAAIDCKYNSDKYICTAKTISLSANSVLTVWDGRQEFNTCKTFEKSQFAKDIDEKLAEHYKRWKENHDKEEQRIRAFNAPGEG